VQLGVVDILRLHGRNSIWPNFGVTSQLATLHPEPRSVRQVDGEYLGLRQLTMRSIKTTGLDAIVRILDYLNILGKYRWLWTGMRQRNMPGVAD
jgi:hypothetical protein